MTTKTGNAKAREEQFGSSGNNAARQDRQGQDPQDGNARDREGRKGGSNEQNL